MRNWLDDSPSLSVCVCVCLCVCVCVCASLQLLYYPLVIFKREDNHLWLWSCVLILTKIMGRKKYVYIHACVCVRVCCFTSRFSTFKFKLVVMFLGMFRKLETHTHTNTPKTNTHTHTQKYSLTEVQTIIKSKWIWPISWHLLIGGGGGSQTLQHREAG